MGTVVNVVVGTMFVFLVFSLVVSGINEALTGFFAIRSKILWQTLSGMASEIGAPYPRLTLRRVLQLPFTADWLDKIPLLGRFTQRWRDDRPTVDQAVTNDTMGFVDLLAARSVRFDSTGQPRRRVRVKNVSPQLVSQVLLEMGGTVPEPTGKAGHAVAQPDEFLEGVLDKVRHTSLEAPVTAAISRAQSDIDKFRQAIEEWFDARMQALSSQYKAWARWIMLGVAIVVALVANVNPIRTIDALRKDTALAQLTADQALAFVKTASPEFSGCSTASDEGGGAQADTSNGQVVDCYRAVQDAVARGRDLPPPLGFDHLLWGAQAWWQYLFGSLLGAIAISLGAPFWFDTLRKVTSLRR